VTSRSIALLWSPFSTLHLMHFEVCGQRRAEPLEQYCLILCRLGDAPAADVGAAPCRRDDIHHLYLRDLREDFSEFISQTRLPASPYERLSKRVGQEGNQIMRLHVLSAPVP
jgi:hypothetical protein